MVALPFFFAVTRPFPVTLTDFLLLLFHDDWAVRSSVVPSLNVPMAVICCFWPTASVSGFGVTAIDDRVAFVAVSVAVPDLPPNVAVIVENPVVARTVARPFVAFAFETVATAVLPDFHVACFVTSWVVPSLKCAV